jgi:hypothetical protein
MKGCGWICLHRGAQYKIYFISIILMVTMDDIKTPPQNLEAEKGVLA